LFLYGQLGAGTSLPALVARKCCRLNQVIITDDLLRNEKLFELIKRTVQLNGVETIEEYKNDNSVILNKIHVVHLDWNATSSFSQVAKFEKVDYLIGSDVFFDSACK
jgi:hypothetical protein